MIILKLNFTVINYLIEQIPGNIYHDLVYLFLYKTSISPSILSNYATRVIYSMARKHENLYNLKYIKNWFSITFILTDDTLGVYIWSKNELFCLALNWTHDVFYDNFDKYFAKSFLVKVLIKISCIKFNAF